MIRPQIAAALAAALLSTAALAGPDYSPSKKGQYPSTNFNAPDVDKLTIHGPASTGEIPNMTVRGQPLSDLLSAVPQITNGRLQFLNGPPLGTIGSDGKFTLTPDAVTTPSLTLTGPGLVGPVDSGTVGGTAIPSILGAKAPLASPTFSGTVTAPTLSLTGAGLSGPVDNSTVGGTTVSRLFADRPPIPSLPTCTPGSDVAPVAAGQPFLCGGLVLIAQ